MTHTTPPSTARASVRFLGELNNERLPRFYPTWGEMMWRVFVYDVNRAWAGAGGGRIRYTEDGGATWTEQQTPDLIRSYIRSVFFLRTGKKAGKLGWAVGFDGYLLKTRNGGRTWVIVGERFIQRPPTIGYGASSPTEQVDLWDVIFTDENTGWVCGIRGWRKTTDGGLTWTDLWDAALGGVNSPHGLTAYDVTEPYKMAFVGAGNNVPLLIAAESALIFRSVDGVVASFNVIPLFDQDNDGALELWDVQMIPNANPDAAIGYIGGGQGNQTGGILVTADGGQTWTLEVVEDALGNLFPPTIYGVAPMKNGQGICVGYGGTVHRRQTSPAVVWEDIREIIDHGVDLQVPMFGAGSDGNLAVWIVGLMGRIYRSLDGGFTWSTQGSRGAYRLRDCYFMNAEIGWIISQVRTILYTSDGGRTLVEVSPPTSGQPNLNAIEFRDSTCGAIVGNAIGGLNPIVLYYDGLRAPGDQWVDATGTYTALTNTSMHEVCWAGNDAWAVGVQGFSAQGVILHSANNDGRVFDAIDPPSGSVGVKFSGVAFDGVNTLYVVGTNLADFTPHAFRLNLSTFLWEDISPTGVTGYFNAVTASGTEVYAAGADEAQTRGQIYRLDTVDALWSEVILPPEIHPEVFFCAQLVGVYGEQDLFVAGERGQVLGNTADGGLWEDLKSTTSISITGMHLITQTLGFLVGSAGLDAAGEGVGDSAMVKFIGTQSNLLLEAAPLPDPSTWVIEPVGVNNVLIVMAATESTGHSGSYNDEMEYRFTCIEDPSKSSGWIRTNVFGARPLTPATTYSFYVQVRDSILPRLVTQRSSTLSATTTGAPDTDAPTPDPSTWNQVPTVASSTSVSMSATVASDANGPVEYAFDLVSGINGHSRDWSTDPTYTDTGLVSGRTYKYKHRTRDALFNTGEYSTELSATTTLVADTKPPEPDPSKWLVVPIAASDTSITMQAGTAVDFQSPAVEYAFDPDGAPGPGQSSSGWQSSPVYVDTGLTASTAYSYKTRSRDGVGNVTAYSPAESATTTGTLDTSPPLPNPSLWITVPTALSQTEVTMSARTAVDPSGPVEYSFERLALDLVTWLDLSGWQLSRAFNDTGLTAGTTYTYRHRTRDALGNTGSYSTSLPVTTNMTDTTAPTPNPSTWTTVPTAVNDTIITMEAEAGVDPSGVEYDFQPADPLNPGPGQTSSGWQSSRTFVDQGLTADTEYFYKHRTRDTSPAQNTGAFSTTERATTLPPVGPGNAPTVAITAFCPVDNFNPGDLMIWPHMISIRGTVDGHSLATNVTFEIAEDVGFTTNLRSFPAATGSSIPGAISVEQAADGPQKVGKHIWDCVPFQDYFIRIRAQNSAGVTLGIPTHTKTLAENVSGTPVVLSPQGFTTKSATELKPYWHTGTNGHLGKRFAWRYEVATDVGFAKIVETSEGFYDGPISWTHPTTGVVTFSRAEFKQTFLGLAADTNYWIRLTTFNKGGMSFNVQTTRTNTVAVTLAAGTFDLWLDGAIDQKAPIDRWGWLRSDPRDLNSALLGPNTPMVFGVDSYDGTTTAQATAGNGLEEAGYTVTVDTTGYTPMWTMVKVLSTDTGAGGSNGISNIAKAARALKGIGGIVRVMPGVYKGGQWGGNDINGATNQSAYEAWWDNGTNVIAVDHLDYPITYCRIQATDLNNKPTIQNTLNICDSHGGVNGLYFYGINFKLTNSNAESVFCPGVMNGGMIGLYKCRFDTDPNSTSNQDYGVKWHVKATGCFAFDIRWCTGTPTLEHFAYLNSIGALGAVDSYFVDNETLDWVLEGVPPYTLNQKRSNERTMFQTDSRGDLISASGTQTGLAPGRGDIWFIDNIARVGAQPKSLSIPGHRGTIHVIRHTNLGDPDNAGTDGGTMNAVEGPDKGAWLNENGFAVNEVIVDGLTMRVENTSANQIIINSTERFSCIVRPNIIINNKVIFMLTEKTGNEPNPRTCGTALLSWAGSADDALRLDGYAVGEDPSQGAWPPNLSPNKKVQHESGSNVGFPRFDDTAAGIVNFNKISRGTGFTFEAIV